MIFKQQFKLGNKELELTTIKELTKKEKNTITFLIDTFSNELNHNVINSSAWKFNNAQPLMGIYVQPEFIQYYKYVNEVFQKNPDTFNPYTLGTFNQDIVNIDDVANIVIKNQDFKFDTSYFRNIFIIEFLAEYLKEAKRKEFLLSYDQNYIARGEKGWLISSKNIKYNLINMCAISFYYEPSGFKTHKFGAIKNELEPSHAFVVGKDIAQLKVLAPQLIYLNTKTDLVRFCEENDIKVIMDTDY